MPTFTSLKREEWDGYRDRLELFFTFRAIKEAKLQHAAFVSSMSPEFYKLAERVVLQQVSKKVKDCSLDELLNALTKHFKPTENINSLKNLFFHRERKDHETVEQYADFLTDLAHRCQFSAEARDEFLRDRFLTGLNNIAMQTRLFALVPTPKFEELITKAKVEEGISTDVQEVSKTFPSLSLSEKVNVVFKPKSKAVVKKDPEEEECYRCLQEGHNPGQCWARDRICFSCKGVGHTKVACKSIQAYKLAQKKVKKVQDSSDDEICHIRDEYCF